MQRGRVVIAPVLARVEKDAVVTLTAKGGMSDALDLARQVGLSKYGSFDFNKIEADGEIEFSLEAKLPLGKKGRYWRGVSRHWTLPSAMASSAICQTQ